MQEDIHHLRGAIREEVEFSHMDELKEGLKKECIAELKEDMIQELDTKQGNWIEVVKKNIKKEVREERAKEEVTRVQDTLEEEKLRHARRLNVRITGLPEGASPDPDAQEFCRSLGYTTIPFTRVWRVGKDATRSRALILQMQSQEDRVAFFRKRAILRGRPDLKTVHDVRSFLGLCSYYKRFIRHFAEIASPLHALTHKGVIFKWTTKEITAFKHSKEKLTSDPVIILPDLLKPFVVQCDACGNTLGAVLMQDGRVVAYESRVSSDRERTLQIYEKEMLAVMHALYSWKHFLLGADFIVQTDHQTLRYFLTQAKLSEQHMRWANFLSMFHFQIVHVEGKKNVVADALSRKPQVSAVSISYHNELEEMKGLC
ncbi:hypothetical protein L7F22_012711 [Adiantum nelumboides]|nr:hypothetical protein [Adiantum nelumboides]